MEPKNQSSDSVTRELTYGEKAVGITFNPGGSDDVNDIKRKCADAIDAIHGRFLKDSSGNTGLITSEVKAQATLAIRRIQEGQMWGVKAATWQY